MSEAANKQLEVSKTKWQQAMTCATLRKRGMSVQEIADTTGHSTKRVRDLILEVAMAVPYEGVSQLRDLEGHRLDEMQRSIWLDAAAGDHKAIRTCLDIMRMRAILFGLAAPTKIEVTSDVDAKIVELAEQLSTLAVNAGDGGNDQPA